MENNLITNFDELATTPNRKLALTITEAGLRAIDTQEIVSNSVELRDNILKIQEHSFDLSKFKKIKVVGFGKASSVAATALEKILGQKIESGAIVGLNKVSLDSIESFVGTHPRPSQANVEAGGKIIEIIQGSSETDLIIVIVSGGGSALLCSSDSECEQGTMLYDESIKYGASIFEMNTVRKHISLLKGGGLAKIAYPATVIGLIFSDIAGENFSIVASGPTYRDESTTDDAEAVINKYKLGKFNLMETPKENKYFEKVFNFVLVTNKTAVEAMADKSRELGLTPKILSTEMYDEASTALQKIFDAKEDNTVVLAAGEPSLEVKKSGGSGGRNLYMGLRAIQMGLIDDTSVFIPIASDGMDNSDAAGSVIDKNTTEKIKNLGLNVDDYLERFDAYPVTQKSGDMIMTGYTRANVSDLMILVTKKNQNNG